MHAQQQFAGRALKLQEVLNLLSISKSYHFAKLDSKSKSYDPTYPRPVSIGERSVRYMEHEVLEWLEKRMEERDAQ
ncbi:helix-turn-helix transcriptional regulator [Idiomarina sp. ST10R2A5]|uniref:helix-turn-helix transcriptional regulator n=1 Tax=Idiomarina sp. ST10R2A5 TaxID=3418368 RepID=UPI003EC7479E